MTTRLAGPRLSPSKNTTMNRICIPLIALILTLPCIAADSERPSPLSYQSAFLREPTDRAWSITLIGSVPSLPGCYLLVHDAVGKHLVGRVIPHGDYPAENPLRIDIPADGTAGDYQLIIIGFEDDRMALHLPLTDLPLEVYGKTHFAATAKSKFYFRAPPEVKTVNIYSYGGSLRVFENETEALDTKRDGTLERYNWSATLALRADSLYRIETYGCRYFGSKDGVYLAIDPERWFVPDAKLEEFKWWQLPAR